MTLKIDCYYYYYYNNNPFTDLKLTGFLYIFSEMNVFMVNSNVFSKNFTGSNSQVEYVHPKFRCQVEYWNYDEYTVVLNLSFMLQLMHL
jgi:hypothetical protein